MPVDYLVVGTSDTKFESANTVYYVCRRDDNLQFPAELFEKVTLLKMESNRRTSNRLLFALGYLSAVARLASTLGPAGGLLGLLAPTLVIAGAENDKFRVEFEKIYSEVHFDFDQDSSSESEPEPEVEHCDSE